MTIYFDAPGKETKPGCFPPPSSVLFTESAESAVTVDSNCSHIYSDKLRAAPPAYQLNMESRKRSFEAVSSPSDGFHTPEKRVSVAALPADSDYMRWGVDETCQYLRKEGLEKWEATFKGVFSGSDFNWQVLKSLICLFSVLICRLNVVTLKLTRE